MATEVSIIVPIYGVEGYIARCAGSLFSQTVPELRFIFVDDCSPDRSVEELEETLRDYPQRREQTTIIRLEENGGVDHARRTGLAASDSEYVLFVDGDDYIEPQMVEVLLSKAKETGADITACRFNVIEEDGSIRPDVHRDQVEDKDKYLGYMISILSPKASPNIFNKLFRRDLLLKIKHIPKGHIAEDWAVCVQAVRLAEKLAAVDDALYNYVQRGSSITHQYSLEACRASVKADTANIDLVVDYLTEEGLDRRYRHEIEARKYTAKGSLNGYCEDPRINKEWRGIYKEVNRRVLYNPCINLYNKKIFILKYFRILSKYYRLTGKVRKLLKKH